MNEIYIDNDIYFITSVIHHRIPLFRNPTYCQHVLSALQFYRVRNDFYLHGYVIMPDHIHLLIQPRTQDGIEIIIGNLNRYTAKVILQELKKESINTNIFSKFLLSTPRKKNHQYQIWQEHPYIVQVLSNTDIENKLDYMHQNPVNKNIVENPEDYLYSSYRNYYGELQKSIEIDCLY